MRTAHLLLGILLLIPFKTQAQTLPTEGLVGYFPLNGNANDESGNAHHGMVYGATPTTDRFGNPNNAYSFDGVNNYIMLPPNIITEKDSVFTFTFWYKEENDSGWLFSEQSENNPVPLIYSYYTFVLNGFWGTYLAQMFDGRTLYTSPSNDSIYKVYPNHLMYMKTHNVWKTFVCKYFVSENTHTENVYPLTYYLNYKGLGMLYFGGVPTKPYFYWPPFKGRLDDIRIYNRRLSDNEVKTIVSDTAKIANGLNEYENSKKLIIKDETQKINISSPDKTDFSLQVYTTEGKVLYADSGQNEYAISNISRGVYILKTVSKFNTQVVINKILKTK
jgi:hypothetical protein